MQDFVSEQTAIALREARFPQPEPEFGQIFFSAYYTCPFVYMRKGCGNILELRSPRGFETWENPGSPDLLFAPSATAILLQLPERYVLWFDEETQKWCCAKAFASIRDMGQTFSHENPAEAAAKAWLAAAGDALITKTVKR